MNAPFASEPQPSGEGAALIAATEQPAAIARDPRRNTHCANCGDTRGGPFGHETSECTWHNPVPAEAPWDPKPAVQGAAANASRPATTQPECKPEPRNLNSADFDAQGEAHRAAEGATAPELADALADATKWRKELELFAAENARLRRQLEHRGKPAVQGAGRDWRGEICHVLGVQTGEATDYWADEADAIVAALGLHDLEQAAAVHAEQLRLAGEENALQRRERFDLAAENALLREQLARETRLRRSETAELEQLRGEVERVAKLCDDLAGPDNWNAAYSLRAALAATAPAAQDGGPKV